MDRHAFREVPGSPEHSLPALRSAGSGVFEWLRPLQQYVARESLELSLPPDPRAVSAAAEAVFMYLCSRWQVGDGRLLDLKLCLLEALLNAVEHGSLQVCPEEKALLLEQGHDTYLRFLAQRALYEPYCARRITLRFTIGATEFAASIADQGAGFDTAARARLDSPDYLQRGHGLLLVEALMDYVAFNAAGNEITLRKLRKSVAAVSGA